MAHRTDDARDADDKLDEIDGLVSDIRDSISGLDDLAAEARELADYGVEAEELIDVHRRVANWQDIDAVEEKLDRLASLEGSIKEVIDLLTTLGFITVPAPAPPAAGAIGNADATPKPPGEFL